jgi:lysozyme family protein
MTNLGVTKRAWEAWVDHSVDEAKMRSLTQKIVEPLYSSEYWDACKCDELPSGIDYAVFDFAVNSGVSRASKTLQSALGVTVDGIIGKNTIAAAEKHDQSELIERFSAEKEKFYRSLRNFGIYGRGWLRRVAEVKQTANVMIA